MITQKPTVKYFDPKLPIKVSSDASTQGLGALIVQLHDHEYPPIAYASRSLTSAVINYCPLELEILSILFACQYFHEYVYGQRFIMHNDHKPLNQITKSSPRIQRFLSRFQKYDLELEFTKGQFNEGYGHTKPDLITRQHC